MSPTRRSSSPTGAPLNTPEERRLARLAIAARAQSPEDCQLLLDALGVLPAQNLADDSGATSAVSVEWQRRPVERPW